MSEQLSTEELGNEIAEEWERELGQPVLVEDSILKLSEGVEEGLVPETHAKADKAATYNDQLPLDPKYGEFDDPQVGQEYLDLGYSAAERRAVNALGATANIMAGMRAPRDAMTAYTHGSEAVVLNIQARHNRHNL